MLGLCIASTLAFAPPAATPPTLAELDTRRFELHVGGRAGARFLGGVSLGGGAQFGLGVRMWRGLYLEAGIGENIYTNPTPHDTDVAFRHFGAHDDSLAVSPTSTTSPYLVGQIVMGLRYEVRTPRTMWVRPSFYLGATHQHQATLDDFQAAPGKTLAGTGKFILHRTGASAGLGLRVPFPERWGPVAPRFSARIDADVSYYFDRSPGRVQAELGVGLSVVF